MKNIKTFEEWNVPEWYQKISKTGKYETDEKKIEKN